MYLNEKLPEVEAPIDAIGERLLEAARLIRERGWCQGARLTSSGAFCVRGALMFALWGEVDHHETNTPDCEYQLYARRLKQHIGVDVDGAASEVGWNDTRGRTANEVIEALEKAARN